MPLQATAGAATYDAYGGGGPLGPFNYIEDVFSTYLYTGNGSTQTITNGVDLAGKGGLVWVKPRNAIGSNLLRDTARGGSKLLITDTSGAEQTTDAFPVGNGLQFNSNGFSLGPGGSQNSVSGFAYASWTFRKQPKFFDVVTYTGDGNASKTISHNLGSTPGVMIVKNYSSADSWYVYHRSLGATQFLVLNSTGAAATASTAWANTDPTSTQFTVGATSNSSSTQYVAYLFAHDAGGFGASGTDNVISCGSYVGNGSASGPAVTLGYESQWLMIKRVDGGLGNWVIVDNMRGMPVGGNSPRLQANTSSAEDTANTAADLNATGFSIINTGTDLNASGSNYIYIAIRRGPMRTPTTGASVFSPISYNGTGTGTIQTLNTNFPVDFYLLRPRSNVDNTSAGSRLTGKDKYIPTNLTAIEQNLSLSNGTNNSVGFASNTGLGVWGDWNNPTYSPLILEAFCRAPGFFDVVCYTGTGATLTINHNLGVAPELMIIKARSASAPWGVYAASEGINKTADLNRGDIGFYTETGRWLATPTATQFSVKGGATLNLPGQTQVAYLFATLPGVSKVGSYTGNGSSQTINCGFTGGARFVLIKRTDSTGDWYVWDTARGIVAANDPHLSLNSTAAEVTSNDSIDPDSTGFIVNQVADTNINVNTATYIYLAIA